MPSSRRTEASDRRAKEGARRRLAHLPRTVSCAAAFLLALGGAASAASAQTISGLVTSAATSAPLAGVEVCASEPGAESGSGSCTHTTSSGAYTTSGLAAGSYLVEFSLDGIGYLPTYYAGARSRSSARPLTLSEGEERAGVNAALSAISGAAVGGRVLAASSDEPIAGIEVCAFEASEEAAALEEVGLEEGGESCTSTDADGEYLIDGLSNGPMLIEFRSPSGGSLNYLTRYYDETGNIEEAQPVELTQGRLARGINARMSEGGRVSGLVRELSGGSPLSGATVCAWPSSAQATYGGACSQTRAGGEYVIAGLASGEYEVQFIAPREGPARFLIGQYYDDAATAREAAAVQVTAGSNTQNIDAQLALGGEVSGTVTVAATGAPLPGVLVCALKSIERAVKCAISGRAGQFTTPPLAPGAYVIGFDAGKQFAIQYYSASATFAGATQVAVGAGGTTAGINAAMKALGGSGAKPPPPAPVPPSPPHNAPAQNASTTTPTKPGEGSLALRSDRIAVTVKGLARVALSCKGAYPCSARISLTASRVVLVHGQRKPEQVQLATLAVSLAAGEEQTDSLRLSALARALLRERHGLLRARLSISAPGGASATSAHPVLLIGSHARGK